MFSTKLLNKLFAFIIIFIICLPSIGSLLGFSSKFDNFEGRTFNPLPDLSIVNLIEYPKALKEFYDFNFGFRNLIIRKVFELKLAVYPQSTISKPVIFGKTIIGKNSWYFLHADENYQAINFTYEELESIREKLDQQNNWFVNKGIPFILLIVPDKEAVYTEYFPFPNVTTNIRLDQLLDYLKNNSKVEIIDLRKIFNSMKATYPLYYRTDSHWTNAGAFIAYQEVMKKAKEKNPKIYVPQFSDFDIKEKIYQTWKGDLGLPLGMNQNKQFNIGVHFTPKPQLLSKEKLTKVLIRGDSYTNLTHGIKRVTFLEMFPEMKPYLSMIFKTPKLDGIFDKIENLQINDTPDNVVKIIEANINDTSLKKRLINYLYNSLAIDDELIGLKFFLPFSFKYITQDPNSNDIIFNRKVVEEEKPDLIIYELVQKNIRNFLHSSDN